MPVQCNAVWRRAPRYIYRMPQQPAQYSSEAAYLPTSETLITYQTPTAIRTCRAPRCVRIVHAGSSSHARTRSCHDARRTQPARLGVFYSAATHAAMSALSASGTSWPASLRTLTSAGPTGALCSCGTEEMMQPRPLLSGQVLQHASVDDGFKPYVSAQIHINRHHHATMSNLPTRHLFGCAAMLLGWCRQRADEHSSLLPPPQPTHV